MKRTPSLTIEGNPLLIRKTFKEIPYYISDFLTIEGNALNWVMDTPAPGDTFSLAWWKFD